MSYATVNEFKRRYPNAEYTDRELAKELEAASKLADEYCNTRFRPTEDKYSLDFAYKLYTMKAPLLGVVSLALNGRALKEDAEYYVYPEKRVVELDEDVSRPLKQKKALTIDYLYGYKDTPQTVKEVVIDLVNLSFKVVTGEISDTGLQSEAWDGEYTYTKASGAEYTVEGIRKGILSRLEPYVVQDIRVLPALDLDGGNVRALIL